MTDQIAGADTDTPTTCAIHGVPVEQYENGHGGYTILCPWCADQLLHSYERDDLRRELAGGTATPQPEEPA